MGLKYAAIHSLFHILTPFALSYFFGLDFFRFLLVFAGSLIIDADHFFLVKKHGIAKAFKKVILHGFGKVRRYPLHNFVTIALFSLGSVLIVMPDLMGAGVFCLAVLIHLLWDLFEDVFVFRVGTRHWKVSSKV